MLFDQLPRTELIQRVFAISTDRKGVGSALGYPCNGRLYLITAAHVIRSMKHGEKNQILLAKGDTWIESEGVAYFYRNDIDIAVVETNIKCHKEEKPPVLSPDSICLGQDIFFMGFPYFGGAIKHQAAPMNFGFALPFIKKGIVSSIDKKFIYFDAHNNPGFSGGPIIFWHHIEKKHKIAGFVSAYLTQTGQIKHAPTSTNMFYAENSGIGIGVSSTYAAHLLNQHAGCNLEVGAIE